MLVVMVNHRQLNYKKRLKRKLVKRSIKLKQRQNGKNTDVIDDIYYDFDDDVFLNYAMENYNNPSCKNIEEFQEDFNRIKYVKRLFNRYEQNGVLRERLILNHIITIYNVFGIIPSTRMLFNRIENRQHSLLKTFLVYLNYCPESKMDGIDIVSIPLNTKIIKTLRGLQ